MKKIIAALLAVILVSPAYALRDPSPYQKSMAPQKKKKSVIIDETLNKVTLFTKTIHEWMQGIHPQSRSSKEETRVLLENIQREIDLEEFEESLRLHCFLPTYSVDAYSDSDSDVSIEELEIRFLKEKKMRQLGASYHVFPKEEKQESSNPKIKKMMEELEEKLEEETGTDTKAIPVNYRPNFNNPNYTPSYQGAKLVEFKEVNYDSDSDSDYEEEKEEKKTPAYFLSQIDLSVRQSKVFATSQ